MRTIRSMFIVLFLASPALAFASSFSDTPGTVSEEAIEELAGRGIVQGFKDGTFRPTHSINRAEFLTILINALLGKTRQPKDLRCFKDLEVRTPQWYARPVCLARELGIVQGYDDGTFKPERNVLLAEALKMSFLSFGILPESKGATWYEPYLLLARKRSLLLPLLSSPGTAITRGAMATIAYTLLVENEESKDHQTYVCGNGKLEGLEQCDDSNSLDGDGCSSICIVVPEPLRMSFLQIDMEANGTVTNISRGQLNVPLIRFSAVANRQDAVLTSLTFVPSVGTLLYGKNYALSMDRNGDGLYEEVVQRNGRAERDRLVFDELGTKGVTIPKDIRVPFLVTTDLVSTLGPVGLQLEFGTTIPGFVEAQGASDGLSLPGIETNGVCVSSDCFIRVNTRASTTINIVSRGSLFVTEDSTPNRSHILLGSTTSDSLLRLRIRAEGEAIDVRKIAIDGVPTSVDSLLIYRAAPGTFDPRTREPFARATNGQCPEQSVSRVCAVLPLSTLIVQPNTETVLVVAAKMKDDQYGAISGQIASLSISSNTGDSHAFEARGVSSQATLEQNNGDGVLNGEIVVGPSTPVSNTQITARQHDVALASIASIVRSGPQEESYVPVGNAVVGTFTFKAHPHTNAYGGKNDVVLKKITFRVSANNVQLDPAGYRLSNEDNPSISIPCSGTLTTGSFTVSCPLIDAGVIQSRISEGTDTTYRLSGNVTNSQMGTGESSLSVSLETTGQRGAINSVEWSDQVTTFSWVDIPETAVMGTVYRRR